MIMNNQLIELERKAIRFIRNAERLALRMDERGFHVAFSGGKDSQVLLALVEMAGVKHHAEMQVTTVDSPNLMKFVRTYYPQVHLNLPKLNMRQLILKKKMLPTRQARYCCAYLKEQAGSGAALVRAFAVTNQPKGRNGIMWNFSATAMGGKYKVNNLFKKTKAANNYLKQIATPRFIA